VQYTHMSFGEALADLLREHQGRPWRPSLQEFAREVGINYATLRSAVMGRTQPPVEMIEAVAARLGVDPRYFREYRVKKICRLLESQPELAGQVFEYCMSLAGGQEPKP
jgi:transcriptional regulator with XRE-family HTH domain